MGRKFFYAMPFGHVQPLPLHSTTQNPRLFFLSLQFCARFSFGLPRLLFPSGAQINAVLGCWLASILTTWPMNLQRRRKICSLMVLMLARLRISSLDTSCRANRSSLAFSNSYERIHPAWSHRSWSYATFHTHRVEQCLRCCYRF